MVDGKVLSGADGVFRQHFHVFDALFNQFFPLTQHDDERQLIPKKFLGQGVP